jgi:hypothetical protein
MDSDPDDEWNSLFMPSKKQKTEPIPRVAQVRSLAPVELQRFIEQSPGEGMAVIYAFVNIKDGRVYVGKHEHADQGESFWESRCQKHLKPPPSAKKTYWINAVLKHGKESFEYYIIWHGPESEVNDQERFWIGPDGLHTIKDHGGWGYNMREGGDGGRHAPSTIAKLKAFKNSEEEKYRCSKRAIAQWQNADEETLLEWAKNRSASMSKPAYKEALSKGLKKFWDNVDEEYRFERGRRISDALSKPEIKELRSKISKSVHQLQVDEGKPTITDRAKIWREGLSSYERAELNKKNSEAKLTAEYKDAASKRAQAQWANASDNTRKAWLQNMKDAQNCPDVKAKSRENGKAQAAREKEADPEYRSRRAKEQAEREAAAGKRSLGERGNTTQFANWSFEQYETSRKIRKINTDQRRAEILELLIPEAREAKQKEFSRSDAKEVQRRAKTKALLALSQYADKDYAWCYKNQAQAKKDGVVFSKDVDGVWCARVAGRGSEAGSIGARGTYGGGAGTGGEPGGGGNLLRQQ